MIAQPQSGETLLAAYAGPVSQRVVTQLVRELEPRLPEPRMRRRVIECVIEMVQNILHHGHSHENFADAEVAVFARQGEYRLATRNILVAEIAAELQSMLERMRALSPAQARQARLDKLRTSHDPEARGAGVGLLLLRERSTEFAYTLQKCDETTYRLGLSVVLESTVIPEG